jgi:hypothetical protein
MIKLEFFNTQGWKGLLGPFLSYEENKVLGIQILVPYSQFFIFFVSYQRAQFGISF